MAGRKMLPFDIQRYLKTEISSIIDIIGNILIFMPFGFILYGAMINYYSSPFKAVAFVLSLSLLFSVSVETIQYFSPSRHSSMVDVFNNVFGAALGIIINKCTGIAKI